MTQVSDTDVVHIPSIPQPLHWRGMPDAWTLNDDGMLSITCRGKTDWFIDPEGAYTTDTASALLFPVSDPCQLKAKVRVDHAATFDAGALVIYQSEDVWAKLALERSPQGHLTIVSVVTRGVSDDCNSGNIQGESICLRVSKSEQAYTFHYSADGIIWHLARYFALSDKPGVKIGFLAQSPTGIGCAAHFYKIGYTQGLLEDVRSGA